MMKVAALSTTPVKGFTLHHPQSIAVTDRGFAGDRDFFLINEEGLMFSTARTGELAGFWASHSVDDNAEEILTIKEAGIVVMQEKIQLGDPIVSKFFSRFDVSGFSVLGPWDHFFSERLGRSVRLIKAGPQRAGTDMGRTTLVGTASFAALQKSASINQLDSRRFRMNIEITSDVPHLEDTWLDQEIGIGTAVFRAGMPVQRCVATTRNPDTGVVDLKTLKIIGDYRGRLESEFGLGFNFGIYLHCVTPGIISVGDTCSTLSILEIATIKGRWNEVLDQLLARDRIAWLAYFDARLVSFDSGVLTINFSDSQKFGGDHDFSITRNPHQLFLLESVVEEIFSRKISVTESD